MSAGKLISWAALCAVAACAGRPAALLQEATGAVSQTLCSKTLAIGLPADDVMRDHLLPEPGMNLIAGALKTEIDADRKEVRTRVYGGWASRSVYREGRGCTLSSSSSGQIDALPPMAHAPALLPEISGAETVTPTDPRLIAALDAAFAESKDGAPRNTQAIVIVRNGRVIAERYAPGLTPDTAFLSHSIAKSVVNALVGVLARDGRLDPEANGLIDAWDGDDRRAITPDHLLRMTAGFGFDEGNGASVATRIWYTEADTARASANAKLRSAPGEQWGYCSRCYVLLARTIGDEIGGGPQGVRDFAQREVFDPLGMHSVTLEFDASGTMMGANAMLATPRDWARFGLLYLNDGVVGGQRILPEGWVKYTSQPTGETGYGAGFWLNTTDAEIPEWGTQWGIPGAPKDAFMARGYMGQYIVIVPSEDLVVVRFGQSHGRAGEIASVGALIRDVIAATPDTIVP